MADVSRDINQSRAMRVAEKRVEGFTQQFGEAHRNLARHAAFPLILTPDLLYQIWANFVPTAPWVAVAHVLLSRLCRQVGYEMYEMDIADRNLLLRELKEEFGQQRFDELAEFLLDYVAQRLTDDDIDTQDLRESQEWTALAYTKPDEAARELTEALSLKVKQEDCGEVLRLASLVKTLAEPLREAGFEPLLLLVSRVADEARNNFEVVKDRLERLLQQVRANRFNPFYVGIPVPPEKFIGRTSLIQTAMDQISNRSHLAVWGGLGTGKTSFLAKIACPDTWRENGKDPSSAVIVRFSCEEIEPYFTPSAFWTKIFSLIKYHLQTEPFIQEQINTLLAEKGASKDSLSQLLAELEKIQKFLVLLIDDYDQALFLNHEYSDENMQIFLRECRTLAVHSEGKRNLSIIVTSKKRLNDFIPHLNPNQSPWYNHYLFRKIEPFDNTEIEQLLKPFNKPITPELRQAIGEIAGGHPRLLQNAGFWLYQELKNNNIPDVEKFINEFESSNQPFLDSLWQRCDNKEQNLLMLIALSTLRGRLHPRRRYELKDVDLILTQNDRILTTLEEQGIIRRGLNQENNNIRFTSSLMEKWVIQKIWNSHDDSLKQRQRDLINLMSYQQSKNVKNAIVWIGKNKNDVIFSLKFIYPVVEKVIKLLTKI